MNMMRLDEFYNMIGAQEVSDWSGEEINWLKGDKSRQEYKHHKDMAERIRKEFTKRIWQQKGIYVEMRKGQGFSPAHFIIDGFYIPESLCKDEFGNFYACQVSVEAEKVENRGAPLRYYYINEFIHVFVRQNYLENTDKISADAVIRFVEEQCLKKNMTKPSANTIRSYLHKVYPECKKKSRNSKK